MSKIRGAIFDLDGVLVDSAKYHYMAWRRLAEELGFHFSEEHNERLKGVSRMRSLEILLEVGGITCCEEEKSAMAEKKNRWYVEYISKMDESELLPGAKEYLEFLKQRGIKVALGSASKNAELIITNLGIEKLFDSIIDGNKVSRAKPDPEVFLQGACEIGCPPGECIVFEDAQAGIEAALRGGMKVVGIGDCSQLKGAHKVVKGLYELQNQLPESVIITA